VDAAARSIPYRWWLIDSWWHAYDAAGSSQSPTRLFEDRPEQVGAVFPAGLHALYNATARPFGAHWSSQFAPDSPYAAIDAAHWECSADGGAHAPRQCVPTAAAVWHHVFGADSGDWGLRTIKIDHMLNLLVGDAAGSPSCGHADGSPCGPGERNRTLAANALLQALSTPRVIEGFVDGLGVAAAAHGVDIMWCMSFPSVLMHSVQYSAMTHGRGSDDSHPHNTSDGFPCDNWRGFGGESTLLWALGLWPFKDTFYSNATARPENPRAEDGGTTGEPMPFTHALVAALSGGGVAPGGPLGTADVTLLRMTCTADGTLLKPTTPAAYIDRVWRGERAVGETSAASTALLLDGSGGSGSGSRGVRLVWKFVSLIRNGALHLHAADVGLPSDGAYVAFLLCAPRPLARPCAAPLPDVRPFGRGAAAFMVPASNWTAGAGAEAQLLVAAPVLANGMALLGEDHKLVPVSRVRVVALAFDSGSGGVGRTLTLDVRGEVGEEVVMLVAACGGAATATDGGSGSDSDSCGATEAKPALLRGSCAVGEGGRVRMLFTDDGCSCLASL
jgi:hypothetical protein